MMEFDTNKTESSSIDWSSFKETANRAEVLRFLQGDGWQVRKQTFYNHCKSGKLAKNSSGFYTGRIAKKYAETWLTRPSGKTVKIEAVDLATEKLKKEIIKLDEAGRREGLKRKKEEGQLIDRQDLYLELAARAVALNTGFLQLISIEAPALITAVKGDINRQREFEDLLLQAWNNLLDSYATTDEFEVLFEDSQAGD